MKKFNLILPILLSLLVFPAQQAIANVVAGDFLGTFANNDSAAALDAMFPGLTFTQLAKVDTPATSNDGLMLSISASDEGEPISGEWSYTGPELIDYLIVKAGNMYAVYQYTDLNTMNMRNIGTWDISGLDGKGMSHISAYSAVPIPAAVWLFGCGLVGLFGMKRSQQA